MERGDFLGGCSLTLNLFGCAQPNGLLPRCLDPLNEVRSEAHRVSAGLTPRLRRQGRVGTTIYRLPVHQWPARITLATPIPPMCVCLFFSKCHGTHLYNHFYY